MNMNIVLCIQAIIALLAGLMIMFIPKNAIYTLAAFLILTGIVGLFPQLFA